MPTASRPRSIGRPACRSYRLALDQEVIGFGNQPQPVLQAATDALARLARRHGALVPTLTPIYRNPSLPIVVRAEAARHLAAADESIGREIIEALTSGGPIPGRAEALTLALADPDPDLRTAALEALKNSGPRPRTILLQIARSSEEPLAIRAAAIHALAAGGEDPIALAHEEPEVLRAILDRLLAEPVTVTDWENYELPDTQIDPFGRRTLRFQPERLLEMARRRWHLPLDVEQDPRMQTDLATEYTLRVATPFIDRREFLSILLGAANLELRLDWAQITVGRKY